MQRTFSNRALPILGFIIVIAVNALANILPIGGRTTGMVSASYPTLFTPAGYTFAIWSIIYTALLFYVVYQFLPGQRSDPMLNRTAWLFSINCAANAAWIFCWHYEQLVLSFGVMLVILITLISIYSNVRKQEHARTPGEYWFVRLPFSLYLGWICVAALANISVVQTALNIQSAGLGQVQWTLIKLALAGTAAAGVLFIRKDIVFALVAAWAAFGISVKQAAAPAVAGASYMLGLLLIMAAALSALSRAGSAGNRRPRAHTDTA